MSFIMSFIFAAYQSSFMLEYMIVCLCDVDLPT